MHKVSMQHNKLTEAWSLVTWQFVETGKVSSGCKIAAKLFPIASPSSFMLELTVFTSTRILWSIVSMVLLALSSLETML